VGRPLLYYLKQVARNTGADSYTAFKNSSQQLQMEGCLPTRRLKDNKKNFDDGLGVKAETSSDLL
jgi:hypothetical protein